VVSQGVVLDRTVAYARGGGQPSDIGTLTTDAGVLQITDTFTDRHTGALIRQLAEGSTPPEVGVPVGVAIDGE
jgi:misacylated tRNA(Ala) deacylase